ncbi:type II toxin-antitoxin system RelE/ParE family toxin [Candidatus Gottesmanbacteria bacterium]|nr:type II toxin-antitoxin system RelE/ParE family toxin [Candidatus Gottesmanbacteria bacterium]
MDIQFYTSSNTRNYVGEFIEGLPAKAKKKIIRQLKLLEKYGHNFIDMKKLKGCQLYEITINFNNIGYRILCAIKQTVCWLLHMFIKKSNDTPKKEINTALGRARDLELSLA